MTLFSIDATERYRNTIMSATDRSPTLSVGDLDGIEAAFRKAYASGAHEAVIWQYQDGGGRSAPSRLWTALHAILDAPGRHPEELVTRAQRLHLLLSSASSCDVHERAVANDARIVARWKETLPTRAVPADCDVSLLPGTRRSR